MSNFKDTLKEIKLSLEVPKGYSREELFENCINEKLKNITFNFNENINNESSFITRDRTPEQIIKTMSKMQRYKDREVLKEYLNQESKQGRKKKNDSECC